MRKILENVPCVYVSDNDAERLVEAASKRESYEAKFALEAILSSFMNSIHHEKRSPDGFEFAIDLDKLKTFDDFMKVLKECNYIIVANRDNKELHKYGSDAFIQENLLKYSDMGKVLTGEN